MNLPGTVSDKLQPHNIEAENAVLGSLLIDPDAIQDVIMFLQPEDFYLERHGWVYSVIVSLSEQRIPPDLVTITDELERRKQLNETGGAAYLTGLINETPTSIHCEFYGRIIERDALSRRYIDGAGEMARLAYDNSLSSKELADKVEEIIFGIAGTRKQKDLTPVSDVMDGVLDDLENPEVEAIQTGLASFDNLIGGLKPGLLILAGRPGMGKTSLALAIAMLVAEKGIRTAIFTLEMSDKQLGQRLLANKSGVDSSRIQNKKIQEDEWPRIIHSANEIARYPITIDDTADVGILDIRTKARREKARNGLDLIIVDYLQLMRGQGKDENRQQEISNISRGLKLLSKELDIPVVALSQLSRKVEDRQDKRPRLADLRESGAIEQDADLVGFIYRDEVYNPDTEFPNIAEIIFGKHRHGPTGAISTYFKKHLCQIVDLEMTTQSLEY